MLKNGVQHRLAKTTHQYHRKILIQSDKMLSIEELKECIFFYGYTFTRIEHMQILFHLPPSACVKSLIVLIQNLQESIPSMMECFFSFSIKECAKKIVTHVRIR